MGFKLSPLQATECDYVGKGGYKHKGQKEVSEENLAAWFTQNYRLLREVPVPILNGKYDVIDLIGRDKDKNYQRMLRSEKRQK